MYDCLMNKQFFLALAIFAALIAGGYFLAKNPTKSVNQAKKPSATALQTPANQELKIEDTKMGDGPEAQAGKTVKVHYVGTLANGQKFDSSRNTGQPFEFVLGAGQVIPGWDKGVAGMKVGGVRKLTIPPDMAYGSQDLGVIPPNSTLNFEIELLEVK